MKISEYKKAVNGFLNDLYCNHKADSTIKSYHTDLNLFEKFLRSRYSSLLYNPASLKPCHIMQYKEYLFQQNGFAQSTADRKFFCLKAFCRYLELAGFVEKNLARDIEHKKFRTGKAPNYLEWEEIYYLIDMAAMFGRANSARNVAMLSVLAYTGCRRGELLHLDWEHVDLERETLEIYRSKTKSYEILPMHINLIKALKRYYVENRFQNKGPIFLSDRGNRLSVTAFKQFFDGLVALSGIKKDFKITPHTFRHSFISNLVREGVSLAEIQEYTGHRELSSLEIYVHMDIKRKKSILEYMSG